MREILHMMFGALFATKKKYKKISERVVTKKNMHIQFPQNNSNS